jgi:hypothetical protein
LSLLLESVLFSFLSRSTADFSRGVLISGTLGTSFGVSLVALVSLAAGTILFSSFEGDNCFLVTMFLKLFSSSLTPKQN